MTSETSTRSYRVPGVSCTHCQAAITGEVEAVQGVEHVDVDLASKSVTVVGGDVDDASVRAAIEKAGYEVDR